MPDTATISFLGTLPGWITAGGSVGILGLITRAWKDGRRLSLDAEQGIRDHYAKEVASLRAQLIASQASAAAMLAAANDRYDEAVTAADRRHSQCEDECDRLRRRVSDLSDEMDGLRRHVSAANRSATRLFEPKASLPQEVRDQMNEDGK